MLNLSLLSPLFRLVNMSYGDTTKARFKYEYIQTESELFINQAWTRRAYDSVKNFVKKYHML